MILEITNLYKKVTQVYLKIAWLLMAMVLVNVGVNAQSLHTNTSENMETAAGGTAVNIGSALTVGTGSTPLTAATVSISSNFDSGRDVLKLNGSTNAPYSGLAVSFNSGEGILMITGSGTEAEYETALKLVTFETTSTSNSPRTITFSLNAALPFSNGHYYEYNTGSEQSWTAARNAAALKTYFGLQGYLVTSTSQAENDFISSKLNGATGWLGASDAASEGAWRWVTGPEGTEDGGAGRQFWSGDFSGNNVNGEFDYWNGTGGARSEPNNSGEEDYAQFVVTTGKWNDLGTASLLAGYVVEFGGMTGDPVVYISDNVTVDVVTDPTGITGTTLVCPGTRVELTAQGTQGTVHWYTGSCGGTEIGTGTILTVWPASTTTYYAKNEVDEVFSAGCASYEVEVNEPAYVHNLTLADIEVTKDAGATLKYYTVASDGTELPASNTLVTGTYYISQLVNGVESETRLAVTATVDPTPCAPTGATTQSASTVADLMATGSNIRWYTTPTGGNALAPSESLIHGQNYYATQTIDCTESATRLEVTATVID